MSRSVLNLDRYRQLARQTAAEGCVLLENKNHALPIKKGETVSVFGRIAHHYYKSGTGSGGMVNMPYEIGILDALKEEKEICLNQELLQIYEDWIAENPFEPGIGWGTEPWSQKEMPLTEEVVKKAAQKSDLALIVIGRTAGEDRDSKAEKGSYYLSDAEEEMIALCCRFFGRTAVIFNIGSIMDLSQVKKYEPSAILLTWQGGMEGGNGVCDVLTGRVSPCGKLPDTIAVRLSDYPSDASFGGDTENIYQEDIFVGYRYFETFAPGKVLYPFGFGRSYTDFSMKVTTFREEAETVAFEVSVTNTGSVSGKEVVQVYGSHSSDLLGRPSVFLLAFDKTKELQPQEEQILTFELRKDSFAVFDDLGISGFKDCWVIEAGVCQVKVGTDCRNLMIAGSFERKETLCTMQCEEALSPVKPFERLRKSADGSACYEAVPLRTYDLKERILSRRPEEIPMTGDQGYCLLDVKEGKISLDTFVAQLDREDLCAIVRGEGMCSPKVTAGTAGAFGGVTKRLTEYGIPIAACADGPSGIRMDCGTFAFSLPNGSCIGSTFDQALAQELFTLTGIELKKNKIESLLGPGINIHRHPLNGRNFEYFSEDPILTGKMAAAELRGMHKSKVTGTIKHFCANNQEYHRALVDSVISARALREIYLKGYEIAVKEGNATSIMTSYGCLNGIWCAGNYDLLTTILRRDWGYKGIVMTDWWAKMNEEGQEASVKNTGYMVRGQNDLYMVVANAEENSMEDLSMESIDAGIVTIAEYQRSAKNILTFLLEHVIMDRVSGEDCGVDLAGENIFAESTPEISGYLDAADGTVMDGNAWVKKEGGTILFGLRAESEAIYDLEFTLRMEGSALAQVSYTIFSDGQLKGSLSLNGSSNAQWKTFRIPLGFYFGLHYIKAVSTGTGLECSQVRMVKTGENTVRFS